ncbi:Rid family detoxifying hydrolase [Vibrio sp. DW001]|uniref:Rid family detoxifying hydrolase n=1 Tax=Vibrio sp. DW001 TaxID=2912315 RepID=UPI0023AF5DCE|nr:Rid family detoxifying hydrolase [Vibrio sp. DW001]WED28788.1 Rid family detoxifying hydrolase [Vibrio sp. DW001]
MKVNVIFAQSAPKAVGCYCHMTTIGSTGYISGQLPLNPISMMIEGTTAKEQATQSLKNLLAILGENGLTKESVAKTTIYLDNISDFTEVNEVYSTFFGKHKPARSCFSVESLPMSALVEIEAIVAI